MQKGVSVSRELESASQEPRSAVDPADLYADIVYNLPIALIVWRLENPEDVRSFALVLSNPAARHATGTSFENSYGKTMGAAFPRLMNTEIPEILRAVVVFGQPKNLGELRLASEDAPDRVFSARAFPLLNQCVGVSFENITERKRSEAVIADQSQLLDLTNDAILIYDLGGKIQFWNKGAERLYGWKAEEALGESASEFLQSQYPIPHQEIRQVLYSKGGWDGDIIHSRRDGTRILVTSRLTLRYEQTGAPVGILQISSDVTNERRVEAALQRVEELKRGADELTLLSQMGSLLQACLTPAEAYRVIAQSASKLFPDESGALCILNEPRSLVESVATWGDTLVGEEVFSPGDCWALRSGRTHVVEAATASLACSHLGNFKPPACLCVPVVAQGEALGVLHIQTARLRKGEGASADNPGPLNEDLVRAVVEQVGLALANLKLRETLRVQSIRDPLTGLFNRRHMEESLDREIRRASRRRGSLGTVLLDIDNFKKYNDTLGHETGDRLLREVGSFLQSQVRGEDVPCRYGGDEFIVILPDASVEISQRRAEQIRKGVVRLTPRDIDPSLGELTLSLGVAVYPTHGSTRQALFRSADSALYEAKRQGGNRVVLSRGE